MSEEGEVLKTNITIQKNHIKISRVIFDFETKRIAVEGLLSAKNEDGTISDSGMIGFKSSARDPQSFQKMLDDLLPDDDTVTNPRKSLKGRVKKAMKNMLAAKHGVSADKL